MAGHVDMVGQQVGEYRLLQWLGGGGFGDVYLAEHLHEHTQVAIKVLQAKLSRHDDLKDFINEARTIYLQHPHIVSLLDFGITSDNTPFLVMTYAPYGTLRDRHPKGSRLPLLTIISYIKQLASALQYTHSLHLVHRDVKPENMLVGPSQEILLSDFGIVEIVHSSRSLSTEQGIGGTLPYMAPEQISGKPRAASDQYALGIVVYEWLTGRQPFIGTAAEIALQHITIPPPSLREQLPILSIDVEQVVLKALAKDPKSRFADIETFARALEQAWQQVEAPTLTAERTSLIRFPLPVLDPISAQHLTEPENIANNGASISGLESVAMVTKPLYGPYTISAIPLPSTVLSGQEPTPSHFTPPSSRGISQDLRRGRICWRNGSLLLVLALLILESALGVYTMMNNTTDSTWASIAYARYVATNGVMFGFDAQHTHFNPYERILNPTTVGGLAKKWTYHMVGRDFSFPAVVDGVVYTGTDRGNLYALDTTTGAKKWLLQTRGPLNSSPAVVNGVVYVGSGDDNLYALDAATGSKKWAYPGFSSPAVVGDVVYVCSDDHKLVALNAATGAKKWAYQTGNCFSPAVANGTVYVGSDNNNIYALDASTGAKKWAYQTGGQVWSSPAVANGTVYVGSMDGNLYALDAATGAKKWAYRTEDAVECSPAIANGVVYAGSNDGTFYAFNLPER